MTPVPPLADRATKGRTSLCSSSGGNRRDFLAHFFEGVSTMPCGPISPIGPLHRTSDGSAYTAAEPVYQVTSITRPSLCWHAPTPPIDVKPLLSA